MSDVHIGQPYHTLHVDFFNNICQNPCILLDAIALFYANDKVRCFPYCILLTLS